MTRRTRRPRRLAALSFAVLLPLAGLAACGDDGGSGASDPGTGGVEALTVEGEVGEEPQVTFDSKVDPGKVESEVVTEGDGEEPAQGDNVLAHIWVGNGYTQEKTYSTYDGAGAPQLFTVGTNTLSEPLQEAIDGHPVGSRVVVASDAASAFGDQGNPQLGIGNEDGVVFVVDLVSTVADGPSGQDREPAAWAPKLQEKGGDVTGLDFAGTPKPTGELQQSVLVEGDGEEVQKGQTIYVDYLGQVYGGTKPFDDSYSRGEPASFPIGVGQVVPGWDQALVGQKVGSRVVLAIPPELGYGKQGRPEAKIKGTDTMYFVIDILGAV